MRAGGEFRRPRTPPERHGRRRRRLAGSIAGSIAPGAPPSGALFWAEQLIAPPALLRLRPSFVHNQMAVSEEAPVEHLDRLPGSFPRGHLHEPEPTRPSRELIGDDPHRPPGVRRAGRAPARLPPWLGTRDSRRRVSRPSLQPPRAQDRGSLFPVHLPRVGHCAPNGQHAPTGSRIAPAEPGPTVLSTPATVKAPGLTLCFLSRRGPPASVAGYGPHRTGLRGSRGGDGSRSPCTLLAPAGSRPPRVGT
jgi:hypothetical protein